MVAGIANRRTSSERWARREAVQESGEGRTVVRCRRLLASEIGARVRLMHTPPLGFTLTRMVRLLLGDVVLTRDEIDGLMARLLPSGTAPTRATGFALQRRRSGSISFIVIGSILPRYHIFCHSR